MIAPARAVNPRTAARSERSSTEQAALRVVGDGLFSNAMKVSVPIDIVRDRRATGLGYAAVVVLLLAAASVGAGPAVLLVLFLVQFYSSG